MGRIPRIPPAILTAAVLVAQEATAPTAAAQPPVPVVVTGRVIDRADSVPLAGVVVGLDSLRGGVPFARTDSAGRFVLRGSLRPGAATLSLHNGFYRPLLQRLDITGASAIDAGVLGMERGPEPLEYMVAPWCERVTRRPRRLAPGTWVEPAPDSAGRRTWRLCDGLLREPRVPPAGSPSRPAA